AARRILAPPDGGPGVRRGARAAAAGRLAARAAPAQHRGARALRRGRAGRPVRAVGSIDADQRGARAHRAARPARARYAGGRGRGARTVAAGGLGGGDAETRGLELMSLVLHWPDHRLASRPDTPMDAPVDPTHPWVHPGPVPAAGGPGPRKWPPTKDARRRF